MCNIYRPMPSDSPAARLIFGCGSQALYVVDTLRSRGEADPVAAIDLENNLGSGRDVAGVPVIGLDEALSTWPPQKVTVIVAHGDNALKLETAARLSAAGYGFFDAISPHALVSPLAHLGRGCILNAGAVIMPQALLQDHVIVHSGTVVEHDCVLEEGCNIAPGVSLAGRVRVGRGAYVYTGSCVAPKITIGDHAVVGAGAVVIHHIPAGIRVAGNPSRILERG